MRALYDVPAPGKLNLFLHITGRRADGYHLLQSVFVLIDWCDTLHFERRADGRLARHDRRGEEHRAVGRLSRSVDERSSLGMIEYRRWQTDGIARLFESNRRSGQIFRPVERGKLGKPESPVNGYHLGGHLDLACHNQQWVGSCVDVDCNCAVDPIQAGRPEESDFDGPVYMRTGRSPAVADIAGLMRDWPTA